MISLNLPDGQNVGLLELFCCVDLRARFRRIYENKIFRTCKLN
jgi:hypothetical protein